MTDTKVTPFVRIGILFLSIIIIFFLSNRITGQIIPNDPTETLIFQGALLMVVFGSTVQEFHYTSPAESMVNAFMGMITLFPVYKLANQTLWWLFFGYCLIIFFLGVLCTGLSFGKDIPEKSKRIIDIVYQPVVNLGRARILFSILFLFSLISFYKIKSIQFLLLLLFWGVFIVIWPLGLPSWISGIFSKHLHKAIIGEIIRTDWPNIIHVDLKKEIKWSTNSPKLFQEANGNQCLTVPVYQQQQGDKVIGTGVYVKLPFEKVKGYDSGKIYEFPEDINISTDQINIALGGTKDSKLIGFISSDSEISEIRFEVLNNDLCKEGMLIWCPINNKKVYYQIINGKTNEENFQSNRYGYQVGLARQIGTLSEEGFEAFPWLPLMNTPIFTEDESFGEGINFVNSERDFSFGKIPGTKIKVGGDFINNLEFHTAILGVTGSGKTELGLDIIRHTAQKGNKVICIDLTMKYGEALNALSPISLSLSEEDTEELNNLLFDLDIGTFSKTAEKKALRNFLSQKRREINTNFISFLEGEDSNVAIISLQELSNTQATLYITEMYLTELLNYAKSHPLMKKVLVVVEEAHTVMPEPTTMGLGDFDSKGLVGKIAQLALQGRKFGLGLLIIAQRTANVCKSILTQCNTIISFNCYDDTSLNFLRNVYGSVYVEAVPHLPKLHALIYGKGCRSQRPIILEIPFDENKVKNNY